MEEEKSASRIEGAVERLNQDPYLLAAITAIPGVGGSITQVITGIGQQIVQERNRRLFEQLSKHLADIDEQSVKRDYFETPEGFDLLFKAMDESRRTRSDQKRDLIARILRGALIDHEGEYSPEEYLNLISDLTVQELMVIRSVHKRRPRAGNSFTLWVSTTCETLRLDRRDVFMMLARLEAHDLIQVVEKPPQPKSRRPVFTFEETTGVDRIERIIISPPFQKMMTFLELDR